MNFNKSEEVFEGILKNATPTVALYQPPKRTNYAFLRAFAAVCCLALIVGIGALNGDFLNVSTDNSTAETNFLADEENEYITTDDKVSFSYSNDSIGTLNPSFIPNGYSLDENTSTNEYLEFRNASDDYIICQIGEYTLEKDGLIIVSKQIDSKTITVIANNIDITTAEKILKSIY